MGGQGAVAENTHTNTPTIRLHHWYDIGNDIHSKLSELLTIHFNFTQYTTLHLHGFTVRHIYIKTMLIRPNLSQGTHCTVCQT